jgi:hypothetical protein
MQMLHYLQKSDEGQQLLEKKKFLLDKQKFLSKEEARAVGLQEHLHECNKYVFDIRRELRNEGMNSEEIKEDETYLAALASVDAAKLLQSELKQQIAKAKEEIAELKQEVDDANLAIPTELTYLQDDCTDKDATPAPPKAFTRFKEQREFTTEGNDGSDEELAADYEIANDIEDGEGSDEDED